MELLFDQWALSCPDRGFHRTKVSKLVFELRLLQDSTPKDTHVKITPTKIEELLRKKSRDAINTAYMSGREWYIWRGSERTADDKSKPTRPSIYARIHLDGSVL